MKHILIAGGTALALTMAVPFSANAQVAQPSQPAAGTPGTSSQPPKGGATGTTDRQGHTNRPLEPSSTQQPPRNDVVGDPDRQRSDTDRTPAQPQFDRDQSTTNANDKAQDQRSSPTPGAVGTSGSSSPSPRSATGSTAPASTADVEAQPAQTTPAQTAPAQTTPAQTTPPSTSGRERGNTTPSTTRPADVSQRTDRSNRSRPDTPTGTSGAADPVASGARTLPATASPLPFVALSAVLVLALALAIRLGVNSID
jgi:hypothetical protein